MSDRVRIFDTTLRDGEQSPGASMTAKEKLEVAMALGRLGVDVIEAGFPAASPDDLAAVREIARRVHGPIVCGLARAARNDIERAWEAVRESARPRIHTFIATSDLHLEHKLKMTRDEVRARVRQMVAFARSLCADVEFSAEDAARSEPDFLCEIAAIAVASGATTINIPDTVGYSTPAEFGALIRRVRAYLPEHVIVSVHCHDDLGLAAANTLSGVMNGARQVEVTINGIGERAGNTSLEEVVMALHTRGALFGVQTGIDHAQLVPTSRLVSSVTGFPVPPNKAIVGSNAFAHESGIHQDGMLKHQGTYEIMRPETVGATQTRLVLGKHSGRSALRSRLSELGHELDDATLDKVFVAFKAIADKKKDVTDADLEALLGFVPDDDGFALDGLQVTCGTIGMPTATVRLRDRAGATHVHAATGTGPVDATFRAIDGAAGVSPQVLLEYTVRSVTEGIDALGNVSVRIADGRVFAGHAADTDIVVASALAYLAAVNRMLASRERLKEAS
jgi:2-isopropylmalate synthase